MVRRNECKTAKNLKWYQNGAYLGMRLKRRLFLKIDEKHLCLIHLPILYYRLMFIKKTLIDFIIHEAIYWYIMWAFLQPLEAIHSNNNNN